MRGRRFSFDIFLYIGGLAPGATLYTHLNVREDALDLFGFVDRRELEYFK